MFECDVKLSADDVPFLLHDDMLSRTTNAPAAFPLDHSLLAGDHPWQTLSQLDAGSWHGPTYAGEPPATLANLARYCRANGYAVNLEIKPTPGTDHHTGVVVAAHAQSHWRSDTLLPLLTSFSTLALQGALDTAPELPRGLLLDELWPDWRIAAQRLGVVAVVCRHTLWTPSLVAQVKLAGWRCLSYTVNDAAAVKHLQDLDTDGVITDRVDHFTPD